MTNAIDMMNIDRMLNGIYMIRFEYCNSSKGSNWSDGVSHQMSNQSELWNAPMQNKPSRGPPPGLSNNKGGLSGTNTIASTSASGSSTNGWIGSSLSSRVAGTNNWNNGNSGSWPSTWLLLKNMTAQVRSDFYAPKQSNNSNNLYFNEFHFFFYLL